MFSRLYTYIIIQRDEFPFGIAIIVSTALPDNAVRSAVSQFSATAVLLVAISKAPVTTKAI